MSFQKVTSLLPYPKKNSDCDTYLNTLLGYFVYCSFFFWTSKNSLKCMVKQILNFNFNTGIWTFSFPIIFFFFFALKFSSIYILKLTIFFFLMFLFQMFSNTYCKYTFVILFEYVFQRLCKNILYKTIIDLFFRLPVYLNNVPIYVVFGHRFKCFSWAHTLCQHVNVHEKTPVLQLPVCVRRKSYQREKNISLTIY